MEVDVEEREDALVEDSPSSSERDGEGKWRGCCRASSRARVRENGGGMRGP